MRFAYEPTQRQGSSSGIGRERRRDSRRRRAGQRRYGDGIDHLCIAWLRFGRNGTDSGSGDLAPGECLGANTECSSFPSVTYTGTSAGAGLNEFGNVTGKLNPEEDPTAFKSATGIKDKAGQVLDWYVASDDPPTTGELDNAIVASGDKNGNFEEITIPVLQDPIGLAFSLPTGCLIPSGSALDIDGKTLAQLWEGNNPAEPATNDPGGIPAQGGYGAATGVLS